MSATANIETILGEQKWISVFFWGGGKISAENVDRSDVDTWIDRGRYSKAQDVEERGGGRWKAQQAYLVNDL